MTSVETDPQLNKLARDYYLTEAFIRLDVAEETTEALAFQVDGDKQFDPKLFEGSGLSESQLESVRDFGTALLKSVLRSQKNNEQVIKSESLPRLPQIIVDTYKGLDGNKASGIFNGAIFNVEDFIDDLDYIPTESFEDFTHKVVDISKSLPTASNGAILLGLGIARLTQFFSDERVQDKLRTDRIVGPTYANFPPLGQAFITFMTLHFKYSPNQYVFAFRQLFGNVVDELGGSKTYVSELQALENSLDVLLYKGRLNYALERIARHSLIQASRYVESFVDSEEGDQRLQPNPEAGDTLSAEVDTDASKDIDELILRAKKIYDELRIIKGALAIKIKPFKFPTFPSLTYATEEGLPTDSEEQVEQLQIGREIAESVNRHKKAELASLRDGYFMSASEVKAIDGSRKLTSDLINGRIGDRGRYAPELSTDKAVETVGLLYRLSLKLENGDAKQVFDELFLAVEREAELREWIIEPGMATGLGDVVNWLVQHKTELYASDKRVLNGFVIKLNRYLAD